MSMGLVDTMMVGPLGPAAIGAVGTGSMLYLAVMVVGIGMLLALDTFVSQSFGAGRIDECHRWLFAGMQLAAVLTVVLTGLSFALVAALPAFGLHPDVLAYLTPYMIAPDVVDAAAAGVRGVPPLPPGDAHRPAGDVRAGRREPRECGGELGADSRPARHSGAGRGRRGVRDGGVARGDGGVSVSRDRASRARAPSGLHDVPFAFDPARMWRIVRLGVPAAGQMLLEVGVFAAASALAGRIAPAAVGGAQDRPEHRRLHLHGAVRVQHRRRRCAWATPSAGATAGARGRRLGRDSARAGAA